MKDYEVNRSDEDRSHSMEFGLKDSTGFMMIGIGIVIALWILFNIYGMIRNPEKIRAFDVLFAGSATDLRDSVSDRGFTASDKTFRFFIYFYPLFLLSIAAGIAKALIQGGINLMNPELKKFEKKLSDTLEKFRVSTRPRPGP